MIKSILLGAASVFLLVGVAVACYQPPVDCIDCAPSITPEVTQEVTPEPSVEPTTTPEAPADTNVSDNRVDQFSCTINDCNTHKADKPVVVPKAAPNTGYPPCSEPRTCGWK